MERFTNAGRQAIVQDNLYAALVLALSMPEICGSLEDPGPNKSKRRYIAWATTWLEPRFTVRRADDDETIFVNAADLYQVRCSMLHLGSAEIDEARQDEISRFEFCDKSVCGHMNRVAGVTIDGVEMPSFIQLKVDLFCAEIFLAVDEWNTASKDNAAIQTEKAKLLTIRMAGDRIGGFFQLGRQQPR